MNVRISEGSYARWLKHIDMFLAFYNKKHHGTDINLRGLFSRGISPEVAGQMILGVKNTPEEDEIARRIRDQQENIPSLDDYFLPDFVPGE